MKTVTAIDRGWIGHHICGDRCRFRRNTLIECGRRRVVVSTVGLFYAKPNDTEPTEVGDKRFYETMAFRASRNGPYWDADTTKRISFGFASLPDWKGADSDIVANNMHDLMCGTVFYYLQRGKKL